MLTIRKATLDDLGGITEIYNDAILNTIGTFDTETKNYNEQKSWFTNHNSQYPILVAEHEDSVIGWASLSKWSNRCAYSGTAEISLYVREEHRQRGNGRRLITAILHKGKKAGLHTVIARIAEGNEISVHLHKSVGFMHIGTMKEVGRKFGKLLDVHLMQYIYNK
jgi:L-amino acid N-acyltransferase YncA